MQKNIGDVKIARNAKRKIIYYIICGRISFFTIFCFFYIFLLLTNLTLAVHQYDFGFHQRLGLSIPDNFSYPRMLKLPGTQKETEKQIRFPFINYSLLSLIYIISSGTGGFSSKSSSPAMPRSIFIIISFH